MARGGWGESGRLDRKTLTPTLSHGAREEEAERSGKTLAGDVVGWAIAAGGGGASRPASAGRSGASTIVFARHGPEWEMLNGVTFEGRSQALHEIDIAIVPGAVAAYLRNRQGGSPTGRPRVSIECKDVGTNGSVDEMRAFVARLYDITLLHSHHRYLPLPDPPRAIHPDAPPDTVSRAAPTYWEENRNTLNILARRTGFVKGAVVLSGYHVVAPYDRIVVGSSTAVELMDDVAHWISRQGY